MHEPQFLQPAPAAARFAETDVGFAGVVVEVAPDAILVCDHDGVILMANQQVENMFGYDRDALVGAPVDTLLPARFRTAHEARRAEYVAAPKTRPMDIGFDLRGRHADGTEFPVEISLSPVASGHGTAIIVVMRETSRQRAALILDEDERIAADSHDRVIGHLLRGGFTLAGILGRSQVESEVAERIHEVMNQLDSAVAEIRKTVFDRLTTHQP